ncbi:MAG: hypothetical protein ACFBRM_14980 [Pikeienuella sp.]
MRAPTLLLPLALAVAACASPQVVEVVQPGDDQLSCAELETEIVLADGQNRSLQGIQVGSLGSPRTRTTVNPNAALNRQGVGRAQIASQERRDYLLALFDAKDCTPS